MPARLLTSAAALLAMLLAYGATRLAAGPTSLWVLTAALGAAAAVRPAFGLLILAGFAPLGGAVAALAGLRTSWTEPLALAVLAGWLLRRTVKREAWEPVATGLAALLAVVVLASLLVQGAVAFEVGAPEGASFPGTLLAWATHGRTGLRTPLEPDVSSAVRLLCGLGVFTLAVETGRRQPPVAAAAAILLTLSVSAVAALNVNRLVEVALRSGTGFLPAILELHRSLRISSTVPDVNAVGALFALVLPSAAALAGERKAARMIGGAALVLVAAGLWMSGSRAGMVGGAVALVAYATAVAFRGWTRARIAVGAILLVSLMAALVAWYPRTAAHTSIRDAWLIRKYLAIASVRMARDAPLFGVGIGRFRAESSRFAPSELRRYYADENAHNQALQVLAELGLLGLALFVALAAVSMAPGRRGTAPMRPPGWRTPMICGLCGFLLASLLMHPLLVAEVSAAFWLALGLARAMRASQPETPRGRAALALPALAALVVVAAMPARIAGTRASMNLDGAGIGLSSWHTDPESGRRFRSAKGRASVYLDASRARVRLPLRATGEGPPSTVVTLVMDGRPAGQVSLEAGRWTDLAMILPTTDERAPRFRRLDLGWVPTARSSRLDVGRETYTGVQTTPPGN